MTLRVASEVTVDGKQATVELKKLVGNVADTKIALAAAKAEAAKLSAELKGLNRATAEGATRAGELKQQLRAATIAETEAASAAAAAARAYDNLNRSQGRVANSAGQVRAATANLGQQIGDIGQGLALGIAPATIFAQQAGQVGLALSGMSGALGKVGSFLSGPFGAALTVGVIGLGVLAGAHKTAGAGADTQADATKKLKDATEEYDRAVGLSVKSTEEIIRVGKRQAEQEITTALAIRKKLAAQIDAAIEERRATQQRSQGFGQRGEIATLGLPVRDSQIAGLEAAAARNEAGISTAQIRVRAGEAVEGRNRVREATDKAFAANERYRRSEEQLIEARSKGTITQLAFDAQLLKATNQRDASLAAIGAASRAATAATRENNSALREAERDATRAAEAAERFAKAQADGVQNLLNTGRDFGRDIATNGAPARNDLLDQQVAKIDQAGEKVGQKAADGFRDGALADAAAIGQAIGGSAGRVFSSIAALGFGTKGEDGITRDATGVGGRLEKLLSPLGDVFGSGGKKFAGLVGQAAGGAATGSVVSGIGDALGIKNSKVGAQIGGAIGSFIPIPGGELIGSVLGGLVGGLIGIKKGSTTISASGGKVSSSGTGNAAVQKATGAIGNTITDAIQSIADQLGGTIGDFSVSIGKRGDAFRVDRSGRGKLNGSTVTGTNDEAEALSLALADALRDGAVKTTPRVQQALLQYADNVNKAVAEALKVKGLEDLLSDRDNPFTSTFRQLEQQLKQRVDVASKYGFDLVQIEKVNGEDRAKALKETLEASTGSVRALLNDLKFGSRATGSPVERLAGLATERDRLSGLVRGGDTSQLDAIAAIIQQIDELQKETFGATGGFADGRADSVALLNDLVRQTEDRIKAAADAARTAVNPQLTEANASLDDLVGGQRLTNERLAQLIASGFGFAGGGSLDLREFQR